MPVMSQVRAAIRPLPEHLINQIAAGEVVERPVSVVKELVENSLDAGATRIDIDVVAGGIEQIIVSDNGSGMPGHEIGAALTRHCTSKISSAVDLDAIATLGFRGEALASIAAVAELIIVTRVDEQAHAWRLAAAPGVPPGAPQPAQGARGTRIEVRGLFHRVPARRRFLKQPRTEYLHIYRLVRQLAFARPDVAFNLNQDGNRGLRLRPAAYAAPAPRWQTVFGKAFCAGAHAVEVNVDGVRINGWVGGPELATNLADTQFLVLNGRVIRDQQLSHAVRLAYDQTIDPGRFPAFALAVEVDTHAVDVNVHPGKLEVRFVDVRTVHDVIHVAVKRALTGGAMAATPKAEQAPDAVPPRHFERVREATAAYPRSADGRGEQPAAKLGRALARVEHFVLFSDGDTVLVLDLRLAWREVLGRRLAAGSGTPRPLLLPQRLSAAAAARLASDAALRRLGFEFDDLGAAGVVLRAVPTVLPPLDPGLLIAALIEELDSGATAVAALAAAAANVVAGGDRARSAHALLADLAPAAAAADIDPRSLARALTAGMLEALDKRAR